MAIARNYTRGGNFYIPNYSGVKKYIKDTPEWDDQQVNIGTVGLGVSVPTWTDYKDSKVLAFSKSQDNAIKFTIQLPHGYKLNSNVEFHVHTTVPTSKTGGVMWTLKVSKADINDTFPSATTTQSVQTISTDSTDVHLLHEISENIGNASGLSSIWLCHLSRTGTHASDTLDDWIYLVGLDVHIQKDSHGSKFEFSK